MSFIDNLKTLPLMRQLILAGAVLGVVFAMTFLVRGAMQEPMSLLYSGLDPVHAGEIIEELEQRGIAYDIQGAAIFIPQKHRDAVRFALAKEGLPRPSVQGYELLDEVNGFSVTSEMYNAAYWRAKEGELTRTILAIPGVTSARVHIGASLRSGFARSQPAQTASVTLSASHDLSAKQAEAIQYLVALAVSGLKPGDVAVIDPRYGILAGPNVDKVAEPGVLAETQAGMLEQKILRLLDARVGPGNARVSVSVDINRERQRTSTVAYDPESRVVRSRSNNDISESSSGGTPALTVASNLPQGGNNTATPSSSTLQNSTESVSYEINETRTETEILPGEIERISIAVILNEQVLGIDRSADGTAAIIEQIIADFEQLITSGAGLNIDRGDALTVELMPFQELVVADMVTAPGMLEQLIQRYFWSGLQALLLGLVVIVLGVGVIRPLLANKANTEAVPATGSQPGTTGISEPEPNPDPFAYLQDYARVREDETAALLQEWLTEDKKVAVNE